MHQIEKNAGEGITTIGKLIQNAQCERDPVNIKLEAFTYSIIFYELIFNNQEYLKAKKKFYRFHGYSALSNMISLAATVGQFYLLSNKSFFVLKYKIIEIELKKIYLLLT